MTRNIWKWLSLRLEDDANDRQGRVSFSFGESMVM